MLKCKRDRSMSVRGEKLCSTDKVLRGKSVCVHCVCTLSPSLCAFSIIIIILFLSQIDGAFNVPLVHTQRHRRCIWNNTKRGYTKSMGCAHEGGVCVYVYVLDGRRRRHNIYYSIGVKNRQSVRQYLLEREKSNINFNFCSALPLYTSVISVDFFFSFLYYYHNFLYYYKKPFQIKTTKERKTDNKQKRKNVTTKGN